MQRLGIFASIATAVMVGASSVASAAIGQILYDSHGFEASVNPAINYQSGASLVGNPPGAAPKDKWTGQAASVNPLNLSAPASGVYNYFIPTAPNFQFAGIAAANVSAGGYGYFYPNSNNPLGGGTAYVPAAGEQIAITFSMNVYSANGAGAPYAGNGFFGVSAFSTTGLETASVGIDNSTGALALPSGSTTYNGGFTASFDRFYGYELLLNYSTQTWSIYTDPLTGPGAGSFTLRASGSFATPSLDFSDADLASFGLGSTNFSGFAAFDDYLVQVVPEPTSLAVIGVASGLLVSRRRKASV